MRCWRAAARDSIRSENVHPDAFSGADLAQFTGPLAEPGRGHVTREIYRTFQRRELPALLRGQYADAVLTVPTLLLFGQRDRVISPHMVDAAEHRDDPLSVVRVADSGHFIADERPDVVADRTLDFFGGPA